MKPEKIQRLVLNYSKKKVSLITNKRNIEIYLDINYVEELDDFWLGCEIGNKEFDINIFIGEKGYDVTIYEVDDIENMSYKVFTKPRFYIEDKRFLEKIRRK